MVFTTFCDTWPFNMEHPLLRKFFCHSPGKSDLCGFAIVAGILSDNIGP